MTTADYDVRIQPSVDYDGWPVCEVCNERIDPQRPGVFILVLGWVESRSGGGAHGVSDRRDLGRYRHKSCHRFGDHPALF